MATKQMRALPADFNERMLQLQTLETWAYSNNMPIAARGINNAKNAIGWEVAGNIHRAELATRGLREEE